MRWLRWTSSRLRSVEQGEFVEVFVDTPFDECARRDVKGLYAKALRGELKNFTGLDSPYEAPTKPEVHLLAGQKSIEMCLEDLLNALPHCAPVG